ncbi:hypothetical protein MACK_000043 [Theileria orientalis]|uniref:Uncharacterized protein n=1 Tax=Theileria orientalis TaxID=68886 RepID=A0A976M900_THEOR|nr:hypothetical protein MACK_000043 [Theileria orientalis]
MAYEHGYSAESYMDTMGLLSDGQDELVSWLYGPYKNVPVYGQDTLDQWLYGPFLTQKPAEDKLKTPVKTFQTPVKTTDNSEKKFEFPVQTLTDNTSHVTSVDVTSDSVTCNDESEDDIPYAPRNIKYPF